MEEKLISIYSSLDLSIADSIINAAIKIRADNGILPQAIVVLDSGGQLVAFKRENGCGILRFDIAVGKAWAALGMGMSTRQLRDRLADRPVFQSTLAGASDGRFIPVPGGVLILNQQRVAIGAVGVSGDTSDKDEYCAIEAIKLSAMLSEPSAPSPEWNSSQL